MIKRGEISAEVYTLQRLLQKAGYPIDADGVFGEQTEDAVRNYQERNGLKVDGIVGPVTMGRLEAAVTPLPPAPTTDKDAFVYTVLAIAGQYVGTRESGGANRGPLIDKWLKDLGLDTGLPWCMAFVQAVYKEAAALHGIPDPLRPDTGGVLDLWNRAPKAWRVGTYLGKPGDIMIMDFGGGSGHTGLVVRKVGAGYQTIEGNTNAAGGREGIEVAEKRRLCSDSKLRGFIRVPVGE